MRADASSHERRVAEREAANAAKLVMKAQEEAAAARARLEAAEARQSQLQKKRRQAEDKETVQNDAVADLESEENLDPAALNAVQTGQSSSPQQQQSTPQRNSRFADAKAKRALTAHSKLQDDSGDFYTPTGVDATAQDGSARQTRIAPVSLL